MKKTFIIAEAGVNHNGKISLAKKLIDEAYDCGADAVKFQTFKAEDLVSKFAEKANYQKEVTSCKESQFEMLKKLELTYDEHLMLKDYCQKKGIMFLSTPFDEESLLFLSTNINLPIIKIASGEITNAPFLLKCAQQRKRIILSTGMSTLEDIELALSVIAFGLLPQISEPSFENFQFAYQSEDGQNMLKEYVSLLHCTTEYPTPYNEVNLNAMSAIKKNFQLPIGLSDHTNGIAIAIAAVAMGAEIIEKHFTLDRSLPGPDHKASLEPNELRALIQSIRQVEQALGLPIKQPSPSEMKNMLVARKSLIALKPIKKGEIFTVENVGVKRPGNGVTPFNYWEYIGRVSEKDYREDDLL